MPAGLHVYNFVKGMLKYHNFTGHFTLIDSQIYDTTSFSLWFNASSQLKVNFYYENS
jgi:hypothetical protein